MGRRDKINFWLSVAGFVQLCVLGVSGALYTEYNESGLITARFTALGLLDIAFIVVLGIIWFNTNKNSKK
jgi:hypothetical protein